MSTDLKELILLLDCECEARSLIEDFHAHDATDHASDLQSASQQLSFLLYMADVVNVDVYPAPVPTAPGSFDVLRSLSIYADNPIAGEARMPWH